MNIVSYFPNLTLRERDTIVMAVKKYANYCNAHHGMIPFIEREIVVCCLYVFARNLRPAGGNQWLRAFLGPFLKKLGVKNWEYVPRKDAVVFYTCDGDCSSFEMPAMSWPAVPAVVP